mmetsp:Transcript_132346/g.197201  ORF Transcript_132346/g.197201 Transcript_132346/m.197201 type:complete len:286 (+) Transcript_132346:111-968(+)|eukprot:CAMPEP_0117023928 /NCGR_PEP_ID=MMETSP0472-20121206/17816_1 /TAXON_ID=693140 ORGANISM="Tiarina fusus, Strain LIS" /NCGR_SAMPLE_ID=MMETSP0472 /ASSEMBLY_ACC=CAM_ASM_000603 /LENGTH=285 /DNA_ID=CAMNT_0004730203 /DNA_START=107 /DNA_END=964 /DNA_ORIENTATION=+
MLSIARLTRQLKTTHLSSRLGGSAVPAITAAASNVNLQSQQSCNFATGNRKVLEAKNVKRLKIQAKKKKNVNKPSSKTTEDAAKEIDASSNQPFLQHQEWVKFQQSITVDGFQTGQTVTTSALKKSRGGKQSRKRREKELERLQQSSQSASAVADLKYPAIRYSEEETEELLKLAFAAIPERAGKRGTRNLRRQSRRWFLVRKIRAKYKRHIIAAHERRMEKRHWKREKVKHMKHEVAPKALVKDVQYQQAVLTRWAETMFGAAEVADEIKQLEESSENTIGAKD